MTEQERAAELADEIESSRVNLYTDPRLEMSHLRRGDRGLTVKALRLLAATPAASSEATDEMVEAGCAAWANSSGHEYPGDMNESDIGRAALSAFRTHMRAAIEAALKVKETTAASSEVRERVASAIADALGPDSFDCTRVWSAWSYGTMGPDDFIETHQRADEIADAALSAIRPGDRLPAGVVVPEEPTEALLSEFGKRRGWTLSYKCPFYSDDDDQEQCWQVTEVHGGVNDREWYVLGKGETPADAIRAALAAAKETTR